jgi:CheY-like chemotaxis protein
MTYLKSCLLIDDDQDDQFIFSLVLRELDHPIHCSIASTGYEALKKLEHDPPYTPDIIFLDLNLPGINGLDCLARIKSNSKLEHIPVVIYTTSLSQEDKNKTKNLGAIDFITKPYHIQDLYARLHAFFNSYSK